MGFVQDIVSTPPAVMRTKRELCVTAYPYQGTYYFKIREIADVLAVKQPFQFTFNIRKALGNGAIRKGEDTQEIRKESDHPMTPFISVDDIIRFMVLKSTRDTYDKSLVYSRMLEELLEYQAYAQTHTV